MSTDAFDLSAIRVHDGVAECETEVRPDLVFLEGHFPGQPVLPAVCQLETLVLPFVREAWPDLVRVVSLSRLKFRRPLVPGDAIAVRLERSRDSVIKFVVRKGDDVGSSGNIAFEVAS